MNLSCTVNDGSNRRAYETQKIQASQGRCRSNYFKKAMAKKLIFMPEQFKTLK